MRHNLRLAIVATIITIESVLWLMSPSIHQASHQDDFGDRKIVAFNKKIMVLNRKIVVFNKKIVVFNRKIVVLIGKSWFLIRKSWFSYKTTIFY